MYLSPLATLKDHFKDEASTNTEAAAVSLQGSCIPTSSLATYPYIQIICFPLPLQPQLNLMLNTFCNTLLPNNATCCVAHRRSTFLNILIAVVLLM